MHDTANASGSLFGSIYGKKNFKVLDIGGQDVNGTLRHIFEAQGMLYTTIDIAKHSSVDVVMNPGDSLPFQDDSFDLIISTSCFEHDPCFWLTFREMCRVVKTNGFMYVSSPSNGVYHEFPGDNWRFYSDAGQALAYWSGKTFDGKSWPVKVVETFHVMPKDDIWVDYVCIWQRTTETQTRIVLSSELKQSVGLLRQALHENGYTTKVIFEAPK